MDRRKNNRNHRASAGGVKIELKSNPTVEEQNPSIYEIDIFSSFDLQKNTKKRTNNAPIKITTAITKATTRAVKIKKEEIAKECRVLEIPLLQSYYPAFQQTQSAIRDLGFKKEKVDSEIQTDLNFGVITAEEKEEKASKENADDENVDKENQLTSEDFQELLKNIMVENLILKDDSTMKIMFKNLYDKLNKNQFHLHQHEHHHHYYFDNSTSLGENASSSPFNQAFNKSPKVRPDGERKVGKDRKCQTSRSRVVEKEHSTRTYSFKCPRESNMTFTKTSSGMILKSESNESSKIYKTSKIKEEKSSTFECSRLKFSSSVESIFNKKSDFITTHIYSDTELKKCDSEMLQMAAASEPPKDSSKSKKDEENHFSSVSDDLKSFRPFVSHNITVDKASKISCLRCECLSTMETSNTVLMNKPFCGTEMSATKVENQKEIYSFEEKSDEEEYEENETGLIKRFCLERQNPQLYPVPAEKNEEDFLGHHDSEIWTTQLKTELVEIKRELKRIEEKHLFKRRSSSSILNNNQSIEEPENGQNITVYSSKTFIVGTDGFYLTQKGKHEQFEEEIKSVSKVNLACQETRNEQEEWYYKEKRNFFERTVLN